MKFGLVIPTLNAGPWLEPLISSLSMQIRKPEKIVVIDSRSEDNTAARFSDIGAEVIAIDRSSFDHGGTRQMGADLLGDLEIVVFLTQDAVLSHERSLERIVACFSDPAVGVAYGRQLPRPGAGPIEAHARIFNYPDRTWTDSEETLAARGLRAAFCSNSFAAYRRKALSSIGGFPRSCIFGEDMLAAIDLLRAGWKKVYSSDAAVFHSHSYTTAEDFRRSFDIGAMHSIESRRLDGLMNASGEGAKFVRSELLYLAKLSPISIPSAVMRTFAKYTGYSLGRRHERLSLALKQKLSMNRRFWSAQGFR